LSFVGGTSGFRFGNGVPKAGRFHIYQADVIGLWGDSLGDTNWLYHSFFTAWVTKWYTVRGLVPPTFINRHVGGADTTYIANGAQQATAIADAVDAIILLIGINDVPSIARATSVTNILSWWAGVRAGLPGVRCAQLSPWEEPGEAVNIRLYRTDYANAVIPLGIPFIDLRGYQDADDVGRTADGTHPSNPIGRSWISDKLLYQTVLHPEVAP
jgi:lysophospholipase L1-like esterase